MTVDVWTTISALAVDIENRFNSTGTKEPGHMDYDWYNSIYSSGRYRRAHIEIVDNRDTHKLYIVHCTIFPHYNDPSPIWGFDAVCGQHKITGAFHDFSAAGDPHHPMMQWFSKETAEYSWQKPRELPVWARSIFSPSMIAASNVQVGPELDNLCKIALDSLDYYLDNVGHSQQDAASYHMAQNRYCRFQKQNPHVINSMVSMGVPESTMQQFVQTVLFPETHE